MRRRTHLDTTKHWVASLNEIKNEMIKNEVQSINQIIYSKGISRGWSTFLLNENIIKRVDGIFYWNENIEVNQNLISNYRKYQRSCNKKSRNKIKEKKYISTLFDEPKTNKKPFEKVKEPRQVIQRNEVGVIRKFVKWLW
tara:strand:+ start:217 stop:636 length:420 start_codon:yes stop_codon:yes gene_type:complete